MKDTIQFVGQPLCSGQDLEGCHLTPGQFRLQGFFKMVQKLGYRLKDYGDVVFDGLEEEVEWHWQARREEVVRREEFEQRWAPTNANQTANTNANTNTNGITTVNPNNKTETPVFALHDSSSAEDWSSADGNSADQLGRTTSTGGPSSYIKPKQRKTTISDWQDYCHSRTKLSFPMWKQARENYAVKTLEVQSAEDSRRGRQPKTAEDRQDSPV